MGTLITTDEIELLIVGNYPDQRDYWLNRQVSASHTPITLPILCPKCRYQSVVTVEKRDELPGLLELECPRCLAIEGGKNGHLEIPLPFGKHRGRTLNEVMEIDPTYLAWLVDHIRDKPELVAQIKGHSRFPQAWAAYTQEQATIRGRREPREW